MTTEEARPTLPGFERKTSEMELAVEETITALSEKGLLQPEHTATVQLCRELAKSIAVGAAYAKTSVPQSAQQLLAALDSLPKPVEEASADVLAEAMRA